MEPSGAGRFIRQASLPSSRRESRSSERGPRARKASAGSPRWRSTARLSSIAVAGDDSALAACPTPPLSEDGSAFHEPVDDRAVARRSNSLGGTPDSDAFALIVTGADEQGRRHAHPRSDRVLDTVASVDATEAGRGRSRSCPSTRSVSSASSRRSSAAGIDRANAAP